MKARLFATLVSASLVAQSAFSFADPPPDDPPEMPPPSVVLVDYQSIPTGTLPSFPAETSAPATVPAGQVPDLEVDAVAETPRKPSLKKVLRRKKGIRLGKGAKDVEIKMVAPVLGLLYTPTSDATDFNGDTTQRMSCGANQEGVAAVRWEKLRLAGDDARLEVADLWFDRKSCVLGSGSTAVVPLKAIAWDGGKPWLYAVRSETSVTFVLPLATEASADTMAGAPLTIRGGFTRVTLPLGRWGAGSVIAQLPSLLSSEGAGEVTRAFRGRDRAWPRRSRGRAGADDERASPDARRAHPIARSGRFGAVVRIARFLRRGSELRLVGGGRCRLESPSHASGPRRLPTAEG